MAPHASTLRFAPAPRLGLILLLVLLVLAVVGIALLTSASRRVQLAPPIRASPATGRSPTTSVAATSIARPGDGRGDGPRRRPENDTAPLFSRDGTVRPRSPAGQTERTPTSVLVADADGTDAHEIIGPLTERTRTDWSPNGARWRSARPRRQAVDHHREGRWQRIERARGRHAGRRPRPGAGPDGTDILFRGEDADTAALDLVKADGSSSPRPVPGAPPSAAARYHDPVVSLDGTHVTYSSFEPSTWQPASGTRTAGWDGNARGGPRPRDLQPAMTCRSRRHGSARRVAAGRRVQTRALPGRAASVVF